MWILKAIGNLSIVQKIMLSFLLYVLGCLTGAFILYQVMSWKNDSEELAVKNAVDIFIEEYRKNESNKSAILQEKLNSLRANEREIIREIPKIINRDVYHNVCIDNDGLSLIERARTGKANTNKPVE